MSQHWVNKNAIIRDLSIAQGRDVPVDVEGTVSADDKPPALQIKEETEEEYYAAFKGGGDGDIPASPDLLMIQQMLDMVRGENLSDEETKNVAAPQTDSVDNSNNPKAKPKYNVRRNVAMASLLQAIGKDVTGTHKNNQTQPKSPKPKLLKPDDFITDPAMIESVDKVNGWLQNQPESIESVLSLSNEDLSSVSPLSPDTECSPQVKSPKSKLLPHLKYEPVSMFKKKAQTKKKVLKVAEEPGLPIAPGLVREYKPSVRAEEYFERFQENLKDKGEESHGLWAHIENKLKQFEVKRKVSKSSLTSCSDDQPRCEDPLEYLRLSRHRHLLHSSCAVCELVAKHGYDAAHFGDFSHLEPGADQRPLAVFQER